MKYVHVLTVALSHVGITMAQCAEHNLDNMLQSAPTKKEMFVSELYDQINLDPNNRPEWLT